MDLHKKTAVCHAVYAGDRGPSEKNNEFLEDFNRRFGTQGSEPEDMADIAAALRGHEAHILIENSTKTYETYWVLTNLGCRVVVANPADLFRITRSVKKTDKNDSIELAGYMRRYLAGEREFAVCLMPPKEWMMRREVCRVVFGEKLHLADLKRRARAHMLLHGIKLSREYSDIFSKKAMEELRATGDPCLLIFVSEARDIKHRTDEEARLIGHMFSGIGMYSLMLSIPGFGSVSAAYLTSLIIDIGRFGTSNEFTAYFGVVPKMKESAETSHRCATTHRGDEAARRLLCQAAFVHIRTVENSVVTRMYERLRGRGTAHKEALVACARKLLTVVWSVLKNKLPYTDDEGLLARAAEKESEMEEELGA
ncbi:MAG: IS110 family transposase [Methanomassiliicoccaceae archaeon]|nr:IS110 family transposase [Methanomassiliicoccaceae archaeon]